MDRSRDRRMAKFSRKQRQAAREEAQGRIDEIIATEVRVNDEIGSHFTVFTADGARVDWWPGARHWREGQEDFEGEIDEFLGWVRAKK